MNNAWLAICKAECFTLSARTVWSSVSLYTHTGKHQACVTNFCTLVYQVTIYGHLPGSPSFVALSYPVVLRGLFAVTFRKCCNCIFTGWTPFLAASTSKVILRDGNNIHGSGGNGSDNKQTFTVESKHPQICLGLVSFQLFTFVMQTIHWVDNRRTWHLGQDHSPTGTEHSGGSRHWRW